MTAGQGKKGRQPAAGPSPERIPIPRDLVVSAGSAFVVLALLRLAAAQFPEARVWGMNAAAWLPVWVQLAVAALGILFAMPWFLRSATAATQRLPELPAPVTLMVGAAIAAAVFWLFRMETYFLGDGAVYLAEHFRLLHGLPVSERVLYSTGSAPLTGWLLAWGSSVLYSEGAPLAGNPQFVFWIAGAVAGAAFTALVLAFVRRSAVSTDERPALTLLLLFTPALLFFFGYIEYYTLAFVGITATAMLSLAVADRRIPAWWPLPVLVVSAGLHLMSLVLLPGVLLAMLAARERGAALHSLRLVLGLAAAALLVGGVVYFATGIAFEGSRIILSLVPFGEEGAVQRYTLLSGAHLGDVANMLLFSAAPALLVLPFLRERGWDAASLIGLTHLIFAFFLLVFGYTGFGMARDWDVNAFFGILAVLFVFARLRREAAPRRGYLLQLAGWASVAATLPWLLVNIDASASERRFRDIMALDDRVIPGDFALNGYEHLRKYAQSTGDRAGVMWAIGKKIEMVGYPDDFRKYALVLIEDLPPEQRAGRWAWMMDALRGQLARATRGGAARAYAGTRGEFRELAAELLTQLGQLSGTSADMDALFDRESAALRALLGDDPLLVMADAQRRWERSGLFPGGEAYRAAAPTIEASATLAFHAGRGLLTAGEAHPAAQVLARALRLDSSFTLPAFYLAEAESRREPPRLDEAIRYYDLFLSTPEHHRIASPAARQQLMNEAQARRAELELRRLGLP